MAQTKSNIKERQRVDVKEPSMYNVVIHNDDVTTMDFVVMVLMNIFFYSEKDATELMLQVHNLGKAIVGTYTYDIAHSKVYITTALAQKNNFPLRLTVESVTK